MDTVSMTAKFGFLALYGVFELGLINFFLYKTLGFRRNISRFRAIAVIICFTYFPITLVALFFTEASWRPFFGFVMLLLTVFVIFSGKIYEKLIYTAVCLILIAFLDTAFSVFYLVIHWNDPIFLTIPLHDQMQGQSVLFIALPFKAVFLLLVIHVHKKGRLYLPKRYWLAAVISFIVVMTVQFLFLQFEIATFEFAVVVLMLNVGLMALWSTLYFAFFFVSRYHAKLREADFIAIQSEMIEKYILQKQESNQMIQMLRHDLRHNLSRFAAIAQQIGDEQAAEAVAEYDRILERYRMPDVGNDVANAIINDKHMLAKQNGVNFTFSGGFDDDLQITQVDFCSLLGNLLENAIEAAQQVENIENRFVRLQISRKNHLLFLILENSYALEPIVKHGMFITRKKSHGLHGFGTISINNVVEKYNGVIENTCKDNVFSSHVMLRCYD